MEDAPVTVPMTGVALSVTRPVVPLGSLSVMLNRLLVRARLVAGFALAIGVVLAGAGTFVFWRVQDALDHRLDDDLAAQTADLREAAAKNSPAAALSLLGVQGRDAQLIAAGGRVLASGSGQAGRAPLLTAAQTRTAETRTVRAGRGDLFSARGDHLRLLAVGLPASRRHPAAVAVSAVRLDNAVRHGAGAITLSARRLADVTPPGCVLLVHDEGTHLRPEFLPHAAERFRQDERSRTGPGSGLGARTLTRSPPPMAGSCASAPAGITTTSPLRTRGSPGCTAGTPPTARP